MLSTVSTTTYNVPLVVSVVQPMLCVVPVTEPEGVGALKTGPAVAPLNEMNPPLVEFDARLVIENVQV